MVEFERISQRSFEFAWQHQRTNEPHGAVRDDTTDGVIQRRRDVERAEGEVTNETNVVVVRTDSPSCPPAPPTLMQAARLAGSGVASDLRRRAPFYKDDWTSIGRNKLRVAAASTFIFFASVGTLDSTAVRTPRLSRLSRLSHSRYALRASFVR